MRHVLNGVSWFVLISGVLFVVASQGDDTKSETPPPTPAAGPIEGHHQDCLACKFRGRLLPEEIDDESVWLGTDGTKARATAR